jgi:uncharacterized protein YggU (UPF0235/DUF167 family)
LTENNIEGKFNLTYSRIFKILRIAKDSVLIELGNKEKEKKIYISTTKTKNSSCQK